MTWAQRAKQSAKNDSGRDSGLTRKKSGWRLGDLTPDLFHAIDSSLPASYRALRLDAVPRPR